MTTHAHTPKATTLRLPGKLVMRIAPIGTNRGPQLLGAVSHAELYILTGTVTGVVNGSTTTSLGAYVGQSDAYSVTNVRYRDSYNHWVNRLGALQPSAVILISRRSSRAPLSEDTRLFLESALIHFLGDDYWVLNSRGAAPVAARRLSRPEIARNTAIARRAAELVRAKAFGGDTGTPHGGSQREQLIRIVRDADRALSTADVLARARAAGITLSGHTPTQTIRRDLAQRTRQERLPAKVHTTWLDGERVYFNPAIRQSHAIARYLEVHPDSGRSRRPPIRRK